MSAYGDFQTLCQDSTLPVCNLFQNVTNQPPGIRYGGCVLYGISLSGNRYLANLGSILAAGLAIFVTLYLLWRSNRRVAAVGRREIQIFLLWYIVISICEIFSIGGFPLSNRVRQAFTGVHVGAIIACAWVLMLNAAVGMNAALGFQFLEDGTFLSIILIIASSVVLFIGTGYIALDTAYTWSGYWKGSLQPPYENNALFTLYQVIPLAFIFIFFVLETFVVLFLLREVKPMLYLIAAGLLFATAQVSMYVISLHICEGSNGKINGAFMETLLNLFALVAVWMFWTSITENDGGMALS